eukprot:11895230-Alexandrium_andersonii.AAC.1
MGGHLPTTLQGGPRQSKCGAPPSCPGGPALPRRSPAPPLPVLPALSGKRCPTAQKASSTSAFPSAPRRPWKNASGADCHPKERGAQSPHPLKSRVRG